MNRWFSICESIPRENEQNLSPILVVMSQYLMYHLKTEKPHLSSFSSCGRIAKAGDSARLIGPSLTLTCLSQVKAISHAKAGLTSVMCDSANKAGKESTSIWCKFLDVSNRDPTSLKLFVRVMVLILLHIIKLHEDLRYYQSSQRTQEE